VAQESRLITLELFVNLLAPFLHILGRFNSNLHVLSFRAENGYLDIVIDDNGFVLLPGEYEYPTSPFSM